MTCGALLDGISVERTGRSAATGDYAVGEINIGARQAGFRHCLGHQMLARVLVAQTVK